jgi:hypothetical protein
MRRAALLGGVLLAALGGVYWLLQQGSVWNGQAPPTAGDGAPISLRAVSAKDVCVTLGKFRAPAPPSTPLGVDSAQFRATLAGTGGQSVALGFRFLGPSAEVVALASGERRAQLGLKLLAQDTCNLLYVMWRSAPRSELVVSLKSNPGQTRHVECGSRGYTRLRSERALPVPPLAPDSVHRLQASVFQGALQVRVDEALVWQGRLSGAALQLRGASGLRSDNVRFDVLELSADPEPSPRLSTRCAAGENTAGDE